jgi:uncharacterized protein
MNEKINSKHVLIAGGSGLIGTRLSELLTNNGWKVSLLSRKVDPNSKYKTFLWSPDEHKLDPNALANVHAIISLAGAGIADKPWTPSYKKIIVDSRANSAITLRKALTSYPNEVRKIVCASAVGYYGNRGNALLEETALPGNGFLADTTKIWEDAYLNFPIPVTTLRISNVLATNGGALPKMAQPIKFGIAPILGSGKQYMSWIHIDDLCNMFLKAITDDTLTGIYNAASSNPVTFKEFNGTLRSFVNRYSLEIPVPEFMLKIILGEQTELVLNSTKVNVSKIEKAGFHFLYPDLKKALSNLYGR